MAHPRFARALVVLAVGALTGACATTRYTQSGIGTASPDGAARTASSASLEIDGLKLDVRALDRTPEGAPLQQLTLRIAFEARELGYSFDPGQVVLRAADGREWRARGGRYLPLHTDLAFNVGFDATVEPGTELALELGGLARGRKRLEPVHFRLARQRGRSIDRMYWLEGLAVVVIAPLAVAGAVACPACAI